MVFRVSNGIISLNYSGDQPDAVQFEDQMTGRVREFKADGEYLNVHHPDERGRGNPNNGALMVLEAVRGKLGKILYARVEEADDCR
jgi:hypothetical protein